MNAGANMVDPSYVSVHKRGAGKGGGGGAVNVDANTREVDPSGVDPHKRKGRGCECRREHEENRSGADMHKCGASPQTGRAML